MTPNDLTLSWMLWLCIGFLIGYRYHVLKVRDQRDRALDQLLTDVAIRCIERPTNVRCN